MVKTVVVSLLFDVLFLRVIVPTEDGQENANEEQQEDNTGGNRD